MLRIDESIPFKHGFHRRGVIGDGSCFFHAVLYALSNEYRSFSVHNRQQSVVLIRQKASELCSSERILSLGKGMSCLPLFHMLCLKNFPHVEKILEEHAEKPVHKLVKYLDDIPVLQVIEKCVEMYRETVKEPNAWVSYELFELLQDILDVNIFIFEDNGRYQFGDDGIYKTERPCIGLYWYGQQHFELIGKDETYTFSKEELNFIL